MNTTDFITENQFIGDDAHAMHQDHEVQMARSDCYSSAKYAIELHKLLKNVSEMHGLDGWVSEKITLANDYLRTVHEYLTHEMSHPEEIMPEMFTAESAEIQFAELLGETTGKQVDMTGKKCTACKKGTYQETEFHDDMDGALHCDKCNKRIKRHQPAASKKKNVSENAFQTQQLIQRHADMLGQSAAQLTQGDLDQLTQLGFSIGIGAAAGVAGVIGGYELGDRFISLINKTVSMVKKKAEVDTEEIIKLRRQIVSIHKRLKTLKSDAAIAKYQDMLKQAYEVLAELEARQGNRVAEAGPGDINRLEHRGEEYNVYFNQRKGMYTARGTGQMKGQIQPEWFHTLADAIDHAEMEIGGYDEHDGVAEGRGNSEAISKNKLIHLLKIAVANSNYRREYDLMTQAKEMFGDNWADDAYEYAALHNQNLNSDTFLDANNEEMQKLAGRLGIKHSDYSSTPGDPKFDQMLKGVAEGSDDSGTFKDRLVGEILNFYSMHGRIPRISEYSRAVRSKLNSLDFDERSELHRQANVQALKLAGKQGNLSKLGLDEGEDDLYEPGVAEGYTPSAGELARDLIKMPEQDFAKKYGMSKQQANHYYSSSKLREQGVAEGELTAYQKLLKQMRQDAKNSPYRIPRGYELTAHGELVKKHPTEKPNDGVGGLGVAETTSSAVATVPGVGKGPQTGTLFGGSYTPRTPFTAKKKAKESVIKR